MDEEAGADILSGFAWNEATTFPDTFRNVLVVLANLERDRRPVPIGSGFVIVGAGERAVVLTAAHNIDGIKHLQHPYQLHHPTTPREFLPPQAVSASSDSFRVIALNDDHRVDIARVGFAAWDDRADLAALSVVVQKDGDSIFDKSLLLAPTNPEVGDIVGIVGFAGLASAQAEENKFEVQLQPKLRVGRVVRVCPDGDEMIPAPFVETSIPIFFGMSGGPALLKPEPNKPPLVFGIASRDSGISSDPSEDDPAKYDRSVAGHSICRLIPRTLTPVRSGTMAELAMFISGTARNPDVDPYRFASDWAWIERSAAPSSG